MIPRFHLILPNAYAQMCFDRNINEKRYVKFLIGLLVTALMKETYFKTNLIYRIVASTKVSSSYYLCVEYFSKTFDAKMIG